MAAKTTKTVATCKIKGCTRPAKNRGLCPSHHQSAYKQVQGGKTTWAELEKLGIANAPKVISNGFAEFLNSKRAASKGAKTKPKAKARPKVTPPTVVNAAGEENSSPQG